MPITLTPANLKFPEGRIKLSMFPGTDDATLDGYLSTWLTEAGTKLTSVPDAQHNALGRHWAYYRAYTDVADRFALEPYLRETFFNEVSRTKFENLNAYWTALAQKSLGVVEDIISGSSVSSSGSASVLVRPRW